MITIFFHFSHSIDHSKVQISVQSFSIRVFTSYPRDCRFKSLHMQQLFAFSMLYEMHLCFFSYFLFFIYLFFNNNMRCFITYILYHWRPYFRSSNNDQILNEFTVCNGQPLLRLKKKKKNIISLAGNGMKIAWWLIFPTFSISLFPRLKSWNNHSIQEYSLHIPEIVGSSPCSNYFNFHHCVKCINLCFNFYFLFFIYFFNNMSCLQIFCIVDNLIFFQQWSEFFMSFTVCNGQSVHVYIDSLIAIDIEVLL